MVDGVNGDPTAIIRRNKNRAEKLMLEHGVDCRRSDRDCRHHREISKLRRENEKLAQQLKPR